MAKDCEWCGTPFTPPTYNAKVCSDVCRKAKRNEREKSERKRRDREIRECAWCGCEFLAYRSNSWSCSDECRIRDNNRNQWLRRRKPNPLRLCEICGGEFTPVRSDTRRCSKKCNRIAEYRKNGQQIRARTAAWQSANPERVRVHSRNKRDQRRVREAEGGLSPRDWIRTLNWFNRRCAYCGAGGDLHMDHVVPLSRGGSHTIGNVVPACPPCNLSKTDKFVMEWRLWQTRMSGRYPVA